MGPPSTAGVAGGSLNSGAGFRVAGFLSLVTLCNFEINYKIAYSKAIASFNINKYVCRKITPYYNSHTRHRDDF